VFFGPPEVLHINEEQKVSGGGVRYGKVTMACRTSSCNWVWINTQTCTQCQAHERTVVKAPLAIVEINRKLSERKCAAESFELLRLPERAFTPDHPQRTQTHRKEKTHNANTHNADTPQKTKNKSARRFARREKLQEERERERESLRKRERESTDLGAKDGTELKTEKLLAKSMSSRSNDHPGHDNEGKNEKLKSAGNYTLLIPSAKFVEGALNKLQILNTLWLEGATEPRP